MGKVPNSVFCRRRGWVLPFETPPFTEGMAGRQVYCDFVWNWGASIWISCFALLCSALLYTGLEKSFKFISGTSSFYKAQRMMECSRCRAQETATEKRDYGRERGGQEEEKRMGEKRMRGKEDRGTEDGGGAERHDRIKEEFAS